MVGFKSVCAALLCTLMSVGSAHAASPLIASPDGPPGLYFSSIVRFLKLDPASGKLTLPNVTATRLPEKDASGQRAVYGGGGTHTMDATLLFGEKKLGSFAYRASGGGKKVDCRVASGSAATLTEAGSYMLQYSLDGKPFYQFPFEVVKKDGKFHFGAPWTDTGYLIHEGGAGRPLVWKMFFSDTGNGSQVHVRAKLWQGGRVIAANSDNQTVYVRPGTWKRENIWLNDADRRQIRASDVMAKDGAYSMQVTLNRKTLIYFPFEVKGGKIYVANKDRKAATKLQLMEESTDEMYWLNGQAGPLAGANRQPSTITPIPAKLKPSITLSMRNPKNNSTMFTRPTDRKKVALVGGSYISGNFMLTEAQKKQYMLKDVVYTITLMTDGKKGQMLAQNSFSEEYTGSNVQLYLVPNPTDFPNPQWTGRFAVNLARLKKGVHKLKLIVEMEDEATRKVVAWTPFAFNNKKGSGDYDKIAKELQRKAKLSPQEAAVDFNKNHAAPIIKGPKSPFPYIEMTNGTTISGTRGTAFKGKHKVGHWYGNNNYAIGIFKRGHRMASKYTATNGTRVEFKMGKILKNNKEVAVVGHDGWIKKGGKKWGRLYNTELVDFPTIVTLLAPCFHSTNLFR